MDMFLYFYLVWSLIEAHLAAPQNTVVWLNIKYGYVHKLLCYEREWLQHSVTYLA